MTVASGGVGYIWHHNRQAWRDIITQDSTFRTMIESAQTTLVVQSAVSHGLKKYIYERKSIKF